MTFDAENRLTAVTGGSTNASFVYAADGSRTVGTVDGVTTVYIGGIYEWQAGASTAYYAGPDGPVAFRRSGYATDNGVYYLLRDHLGSSSVIVDGSGQAVKRAFYYPFGGNRGSAFSDLTRKRFTGQYHEEGLPGGEGLSYYNARWYDAQLGRFVSADTIVPNAASPQDLNRLAYALNNPLRFSDPTGHYVFEESPSDAHSSYRRSSSGNVAVRSSSNQSAARAGRQRPYPAAGRQFELTFRTFAPFKQFGQGFNGNNRGYSSSLYASVKTAFRAILDTNSTVVTGDRAWSDETYHVFTPNRKLTETPQSELSALHYNSVGDVSGYSFDAHVTGANPYSSFAPNIDLYVDMLIVENRHNGMLTVQGTVTGDNFPSTEVLISDARGRTVMLGVGFYQGSPYTSLPGKNHRPVTSFAVHIALDERGHFQYVVSGTNTYGIDAWNAQFEGLNPHSR
jgi:RHS repeat-associated protein